MPNKFLQIPIQNLPKISPLPTFPCNPRAAKRSAPGPPQKSPLVSIFKVDRPGHQRAAANGCYSCNSIELLPNGRMPSTQKPSITWRCSSSRSVLRNQQISFSALDFVIHIRILSLFCGTRDSGKHAINNLSFRASLISNSSDTPADGTFPVSDRGKVAE